MTEHAGRMELFVLPDNWTEKKFRASVRLNPRTWTLYAPDRVPGNGSFKKASIGVLSGSEPTLYEKSILGCGAGDVLGWTAMGPST